MFFLYKIHINTIKIILDKVFLYLCTSKRKECIEKDKKEYEEHHTDVSRYLLIDNIKDAYGVPYLYQSLCKLLIISSGQFQGGKIILWHNSLIKKPLRLLLDVEAF